MAPSDTAWDAAPKDVRDLMQEFYEKQSRRNKEDSFFPPVNGAYQGPYWKQIINAIIKMTLLAKKYKIPELQRSAEDAALWLTSQTHDQSHVQTFDPPVLTTKFIHFSGCDFKAEELSRIYRLASLGRERETLKRAEEKAREEAKQAQVEERRKIEIARNIEVNRQKLEDAMKVCIQDDPTGNTIFNTASEIYFASRKDAETRSASVKDDDSGDELPRKRAKH